MKQKRLPALLLLSLAIFQACKKDNDEPSKEKETIGVYVLFEGSWGQNNSGIAWYNMKTGQSDPNYFKTVNGYDLGEGAQDLEQYGSKMYCVVSGTQGEKKSFLEVINPLTGKSLKRIPFFDANTEYMPRSIAFAGSKAYISGFDGKITRIDTASLAVDGRLDAGRFLEGITVANGKIYAANSDYYYTGDETTVSVVDISTFKKLYEMEVGANPTKIATATNGDVYVVLAGNNSAPAAFKKIDSKTDKVTASYNYAIGSLALSESKSLVNINPYNLPEIKSFDLTTGALGSNFISDGTVVALPYSINFNSLNGDVLIGDSKSYSSTTGEALCFSSEGKLKFKFTTAATNPSRAVFIYGNK